MSDLQTAPVPGERQQPRWYSDSVLSGVKEELSRRKPLVNCSRLRALQDALIRVASGRAFLLQAGDCAETFRESSPGHVLVKAYELTSLSRIFEQITGTPVVTIGRLAGQYAKPRSKSVETLPDGRVLPVYRGDAVNGHEAIKSARIADPARLLAAYDSSAAVLDTLYSDPRYYGIYTSHEALLLDYEKSLTRWCACTSSEYATSAPFIWIGDRTRQIDSAHIAWAESIANPIGLKVGPSADVSEIAELVERLTAGRPAGRLSIIARMGAEDINTALPKLIRRIEKRAIWVCDPMHGNTVTRCTGEKTRLLFTIAEEVRRFIDILQSEGLQPGGIHLEQTTAGVDECVASPAELSLPALRYRSRCDPRLNPDQARQVLSEAAEMINRKRCFRQGTPENRGRK